MTLARRALRAGRLARHAKLRDVRLVEALPAHALRGALRLPGAKALVDFVNLHREAVDEQAPSAVHDVITRQLLVPGQPDRLFELYVGFRLVDELARLGYHQTEHHLLPHRSLPFARLRREDEQVVIWYQRSLRVIFPSAEQGRYRETLGAAGLQESALRPDFVLVRDPGDQVLLIEVKFSAVEDDSADRRGIRDVFSYLHDHRAFLERRRRPRALVVAWDSVAKTAPSDVMVASQNSLKEAVEVVFQSWS